MKIKSYVLSGVLLGISHIMYAGDIQNDIYNLNNRNNASNEIFYSNNMGTTYTGWAWGKDFTQTYENGTLIIGNISKDPNANNMHWFGRGGDIGFINATFNAKEVYITGTLGSGNSLRTGGGANLTFNANSNLTLDNAYIHINRAGTQNSTTSLNGQTINIKNSEFNIENINGGGINIGSANTNNIILDNTHIKMDGGQINVIAKNSKLNFGAINIVNGTLDLTQANYTELTTHSINMTNSSFRSNELNMLGDIVNGRFVPTQTPAYGADPLQNLGNSGQDFTADSVVIDDNNSTLKAVNATIGELSFKGAALSGATKKLTATISGKLNITTLTNPYHWAGVGFTSELDVKEASEVNIGTINHQNYTSGSTIRVNTENKLVVENISFSTDGISGSNGRVELNSSNGDVVVRNVVGCNGSCTGGLGIRPLNILKISGKNFYGGNIEAIGLTTAGSNSTLDLTGVMGTKFIDIFSIRSGTLKASDFHINNFVVYKGNSYSVVDQNIGKSFINYLSMELGTSDTADGADIRFTGGGEILNFNVIDARPTSFIHMSGDKAKKINYVNTNIMNIKEAEVNLHNGIFNTIVSQKGQTAIASNTKIVANALNVNELLHIKDSSKHSGVMNIELSGNEAVNQDFSKYLNVNVDSEELKNMSGSEIADLINKAQENSNANVTDYKNASGTYVTTSDGKHYLILPNIDASNGNIAIGNTATNGGNVLIEQTALTQGALNNYGKILLDAGFVSGDKPTLSISGNLNNYNAIDIGANGTISVSGTFNNQGRLIFRIQSDPSNATTEVKNGSMIISGNTTFDISPGTAGAFQADIADAATLANLGNSSNNGKQYNLVAVNNGGSINYTYTYGDYTTTFSKNNGSASISTTHKDGNDKCQNANCQTGSDGNTQQETDFTINGYKNPWDMDKAQSGSNGDLIENEIGSNDNEGNLIQKPSGQDKQEACKENGYCGFGDGPNASEADRGYDYAQEKMKNSFALTYKGGSIDGKYIDIEKIVNDTTIGFTINKVDINDFIEGNTENPLCHAGSSTFDCALYMEAGGNNSWINAIKNESANSYEILKTLFYDEKSSLVFLINLDQTLAASRNLAYFLEVGRTLDTALNHVSNLENKASTLHTLTLSMESAKLNRLVRVASMHGNASSWIAMQSYQKNLEAALKEAEKIRYASLDSRMAAVNNVVNANTAYNNSSMASLALNDVAHGATNIQSDVTSDSAVNEVWFDTLADLIMRFNKREEYPNHAWVNTLGNLNFSNTGTAQLYGFNAGYDYFVDSLQTAFGAYGGYGYGIFNGSNNGFTSNNSNNMFAGLYTRTFIENHEIDATLNTAFSFTHERQNSQINNLDLLDLFRDAYSYTLSNIELNTTYGYAFLIKKGYIVKPFAGLSYYILGSGNFKRQSNNTPIFAMNTNDNLRQSLSVNIGVDGRKYFANQSYVFVVAQLKQDVVILQNNVDSTGYVNTIIGDSTNNFNMSYKAQGYRSYVFLTGGGEYSFGRWYLNGSLSVQSSVFDKNFGLGFNVGGRVVF